MLASGGANAPKETLYVNNLNERVGQAEMRKSLYAVFTQFGPILDIISMKSFKMRGQAFVVFRDIASATSAVKQMQGFSFYGKPMRLDYAKTKSDALAKLDGSYQAKDKAERAAKRKAEKEARKAGLVPKKPANGERATGAGAGAVETATAAAATTAPVAPVANLPNQILFVEELPDQVNELMLSMLFQQFPGFKEVRLVPGKSGLAFVEFESELQAGVAMNGLQGFKITPTNLMKITYAKR